ncbi:hypothetical protein O0555_14365 [Brevibacillus laterosporus]|uniref:hypothetical protein n=1 Tax=Brevibacillus laterosporus TaxID=1465 RepID=UPI0018CE832C|nr:hypothetical protein [Brevibacillus laterosporus]MBG9798009.1 hypothetical protein [Brevibacillus laterosporus]MCR8938521.1 Tn7 transposase TnsA N-terminal domain-containing protein [Brevibacillus laterosporus]MCZ0841161.1 hypothetical protein [Brevibacillus laterosporus]MCZ0845005.1 hypothetical protein [Brevibacillus laterosporus]MED1912328.1 hypothetical protein [Brevibacillus laterosporus]
MNWNNKNWEEEDKLFYPKRKVDNKIGWYRPHIIGSFHSNKMEKIIEYHSLNESIFYFLLELDKSTIRYYVRPIEIKIPYINQKGNKKYWNHVPDGLVFRENSAPLLYQIKESPEGKRRFIC